MIRRAAMWSDGTSIDSTTDTDPAVALIPYHNISFGNVSDTGDLRPCISLVGPEPRNRGVVLRRFVPEHRDNIPRRDPALVAF
jgi:hypothetical protein